MNIFPDDSSDSDSAHKDVSMENRLEDIFEPGIIE